jgi:hypothetical protein
MWPLQMIKTYGSFAWSKDVGHILMWRYQVCVEKF